MRVRAKETIHEQDLGDSANLFLTSGKEYDVIGINSGNYRLVSDDGEPYLYMQELFDVVDGNIPDNWVWRMFDDSSVSIDPPEFSSQGFFEDYFDGVSSAVDIFDKYKEEMGLEQQKIKGKGHP